MFSITLERVLTDKSLNVYIHNNIYVIYKKKRKRQNKESWQWEEALRKEVVGGEQWKARKYRQ